MAHITLSIPDEIYAEMKKHPEVKWSEIARQNIIEKVLHLKKVIHSVELFPLLNAETQKSLERINEKEAIEFSKKVRKAGWKRTKYLIQA
jgi:hypothetical protein